MSKHVTLVLCAFLLFLPVPLAAQAIDPQKLVGVWEGTWALRSDRPASGELTITISKVEHGKVYGKTESSGSRENPTVTWMANVTETGFGYQGPLGNAITYTLDGETLRGISGRGGNITSVLTRKK